MSEVDFKFGHEGAVVYCSIGFIEGEKRVNFDFKHLTHDERAAVVFAGYMQARYEKNLDSIRGHAQARGWRVGYDAAVADERRRKRRKAEAKKKGRR